MEEGKQEEKNKEDRHPLVKEKGSTREVKVEAIRYVGGTTVRYF